MLYELPCFRAAGFDVVPECSDEHTGAHGGRRDADDPKDEGGYQQLALQ